MKLRDWKRDKDNWNPKYIAYAKEHGKTPEEMIEFDKQRCPNGRNINFILWAMRGDKK